MSSVVVLCACALNKSYRVSGKTRKIAILYGFVCFGYFCVVKLELYIILWKLFVCFETIFWTNGFVGFFKLICFCCFYINIASNIQLLISHPLTLNSRPRTLSTTKFKIVSSCTHSIQPYDFDAHFNEAVIKSVEFNCFNSFWIWWHFQRERESTFF